MTALAHDYVRLQACNCRLGDEAGTQAMPCDMLGGFYAPCPTYGRFHYQRNCLRRKSFVAPDPVMPVDRAKDRAAINVSSFQSGPERDNRAAIRRLGGGG